uniref:ARAD1B20416p n=1 Tax=Blastobotrys adeninivorans TaxID=409370 RepID=A0A060T7L8_BLAAD
MKYSIVALFCSIGAAEFALTTLKPVGQFLDEPEHPVSVDGSVMTVNSGRRFVGYIENNTLIAVHEGKRFPVYLDSSTHQLILHPGTKVPVTIENEMLTVNGSSDFAIIPYANTTLFTLVSGESDNEKSIPVTIRVNDIMNSGGSSRYGHSPDYDEADWEAQLELVDPASDEFGVVQGLELDEDTALTTDNDSAGIHENDTTSITATSGIAGIVGNTDAGAIDKADSTNFFSTNGSVNSSLSNALSDDGSVEQASMGIKLTASALAVAIAALAIAV